MMSVEQESISMKRDPSNSEDVPMYVHKIVTNLEGQILYRLLHSAATQ